MRDPFVIPVPPGATEIDLRPVLLPLIQRIMVLHHDKYAAVDEDQAERWFTKAHEASRLTARCARIRPEWLHAYMVAEDYGYIHEDNPEQDYGHRQYNFTYDRWKPSVSSFCVYSHKTKSVDQLWNAVRQIADRNRQTRDEVIDDIMKHAPVLDRLASLGAS